MPLYPIYDLLFPIMKSDGKVIQSVARAAEVLERLGEAGGGLSVQQLADATGLKAPTVHHLLKTLTATGLCERVTRPVRYRLGPAIGRLAARAQQSELMTRIEDAMTDMAEAHPDATIIFARAVGPEVLAVRRMSPDRPGLLQRPAHQPMGLYTSASGLAWLAFAPADQAHDLRARWPLSEYGQHPWAGPDELDAFLARARQEAVMLAPGQGDLVRIAAPVYAAGGELAGLLGLSLPGRTGATGQWTDTLKRWAERIGQGDRSSPPRNRQPTPTTR